MPSVPFIRPTQSDSMSNMNRESRLAFAEFLTRLAAGGDDGADWEQHVVAHHDDDFLEELRRCVMRLRHDSTAVWGDFECNQTLRHWADALRLSIDAPLPTDEDSHVKLSVTPSEFVVLDSILRRFSETDDFSAVDDVERQALYNLQCVCEKHDAHLELPAMEIARRELSGDS